MLFLDYIKTLFSRQKEKLREENKLTEIYDANLLIVNAFHDDRFQNFCDSNTDLLERNKFLLLLARQIKQEEKQIEEELEQGNHVIGNVNIG